jgi:uncharacterized DUF497 family protein
MEFEWDEQKNQLNQEKHCIAFEWATEIFSGVFISKPDDRRDYGEQRFVALGLLGEFVLFVVYTMRAGRVRLISARGANEMERGVYYGYIERRAAQDPWSDEGL